MKWAAGFGVLFFFMSCHESTPATLEDVSMPFFGKEGVLSGASFRDNQATIIVFLAPQCPLSENYCLTLNELSAMYAAPGMPFYGCVSGTYFSDAEISRFLKDYQLQLPVLLDPQQDLTSLLGATVTPEVFVIDSSGAILYSGAIDNWAVDLGVKREVVTEFYLRDVLAAVQDERPVPYRQTKPVGCFIE